MAPPSDDAMVRVKFVSVTVKEGREMIPSVFAGVESGHPKETAPPDDAPQQRNSERRMEIEVLRERMAPPVDVPSVCVEED